MAVPDQCRQNCQLNKLSYLLYSKILFKFEVAILKITFNMANSNVNLTLKVTARMIIHFSLTLLLLVNSNF